MNIFPLTQITEANMFVYVNDRMIQNDEASISVQDRGFRFGDGVFETIRVANGVPYQWDFHLQRLQEGLRVLRINYGTSNLKNLCLELLQKNQLRSEGFVRIAISRGVGSMGYLPTATTPTLVIETVPLATAPDKPIKLWLSSYQKPTSASIPIHVKTMQGLNSTLARMEAQDNGCFEALLLGSNGQICEGSSSNIFWVKDGILFTPSVNAGILPGAIRHVVIRLSPLPVEEGIFSLEVLKEAEEVFVTNSAWLALPVESLQPKGVSWKLHKCAANINALLQEELVRYAK